MHKKIIITVGLLLLGLLVVALYVFVSNTTEQGANVSLDTVFKSKPDKGSSSTAQIAATTNNVQSPPPPSAGGLKSPATAAPIVTVEYCAENVTDACEKAMGDEQFAISVIKHQLDSNPRARSYMRGVLMNMTPFTFYGKVVDNKGNPVSDVKIRYQIGLPFSLGYEKILEIKTDNNGEFVIEGRGASLFINSIKKERYRLVRFDKKNDREYKERADRGYASWLSYTQSNPKVFTLYELQL